MTPKPSPAAPVCDTEAVRRCVAGDQQAAQVIYHRYRRDVEGVFSARGSVRGADVRDFSQTVFLKVFRNLRAFAGTSLRPWIRQIAHNEKNNLLRQIIEERERRGEAPAHSGLDDLPAKGGIDPVLLCQAKEWIAGLPADFKRTVELYLIEGLSQDEIAAVLGIPPGTVKSRIHRAVLLAEPRRRGPRSLGALSVLGWLGAARRALALKAWALAPTAATVALFLAAPAPPLRPPASPRLPAPAASLRHAGAGPRAAAPKDLAAVLAAPLVLAPFLAAPEVRSLPLSPPGAYALAAPPLRSSSLGLMREALSPMAPMAPAQPSPEPAPSQPLSPEPPAVPRSPAPEGRSAAAQERLVVAPAEAVRAEDRLLKRVTDSQIKVLRRLLQATAEGDRERPGLLHRLGDLCMDEERYHRLAAAEIGEAVEVAARRGDGDERDALRLRQEESERRRVAWLGEARRSYLDVVTGPRSGGYGRMADVLYGLGSLLLQQGKAEQAQVVLLRLALDHPQSPHLPSAYLSLAEAAFEARDLERALRLYDKVLGFRASPLHGFALYRKGRVSSLRGDWKGALGAFAAVTEHASARGDDALLRKGREDLVRAYAQVGAPERALAFFRRQGGARAGDMLAELAPLYAERGQLVASIKVYRELIRMSPGIERLCAFQGEILRATLALTGSHATPEAVTELERLAAVYDRTKAMPDLPGEVAAQCQKMTAGALRELATTWQREAAGTRDLATYRSAARAADAYRARFSVEGEAADRF